MAAKLRYMGCEAKVVSVSERDQTLRAEFDTGEQYNFPWETVEQQLMPRDLDLVPVSPNNFLDVVNLDSGQPRNEFASAVWSLAQAGVFPHTWCRAVVADGSVVGLVLMKNFPGELATC